MDENFKKIPANQHEIQFYCFIGEALLKTQMVEQALNCSLTLKMNPDVTREKADEFLSRYQRHVLGKSIQIAIKEKLYNPMLEAQLGAFLKQRNWLVHRILIEMQNDLKLQIQNNELIDKIKAISDQAENIKQLIEYDLIDFCQLQGQDMSKILKQLKLQEKGFRI